LTLILYFNKLYMDDELCVEQDLAHIA
jgi:hypothetical protein